MASETSTPDPNTLRSLGRTLPAGLEPLARLASNYRWSWLSGAAELFRAVDEAGFAASGENPVATLHDASPAALARAAGDPELVAGARVLARSVDDELAAPFTSGLDPERPVAFFCAEFAIHRSLPVYAGGLGVLAGDIIKEASDRRLPFVGMGLFYRSGYFEQRLDPGGMQTERFPETRPERLALRLMPGADGEPLVVGVPICGRVVHVQVWRADVGRVPLFLLDADRPDNVADDRRITARLYVADRRTRLQQYAVLGLGGMRALGAMGIEPGIVHMNEGHAAFAALEMPRQTRTVLTTHTPVPAGNETYALEEISEVLGGVVAELDLGGDELRDRGRVADPDRFELTPFGIRSADVTNGVSARHGAVARSMWRHLFPGHAEGDVPIAHVTNGVHLPTWISPAVRSMLDRHLGPEWSGRAADPNAWGAVDAIPDEEMWSVRSELRSDLMAFLGDERLDPDVLTVGFARRVAAYKRLHLLTFDADRLRALPVQLVLAGKAHPADDGAKEMLGSVLRFRSEPTGAARMTFVENHDLGVAAKLVAGCDVWINLPTPPMEASGTSGMKSAMNGGLNLSVLDGWWEEAYDGANGWAIASDPDQAASGRDAADAARLYELLEDHVLPLYHDRDAAGIPRGWVKLMKASLRTIGPRFSATRMLDDYVRTMYPT